MTKLKVSFTIIILSLILNGMSTAKEIYKWVDENGVIHFRDSPPHSIAPSVKIETIPVHEYDYQDIRHSEPEVRKNNRGSNTTSSIPSQSAIRKSAQVELYTTSWCFYCKKAREFFRSKGIPFTEYDIEKDKKAARRKRKLDKSGGVPFAVINGKGIHGFSKAAYERALHGS